MERNGCWSIWPIPGAAWTGPYTSICRLIRICEMQRYRAIGISQVRSILLYKPRLSATNVRLSVSITTSQQYAQSVTAHKPLPKGVSLMKKIEKDRKRCTERYKNGLRKIVREHFINNFGEKVVLDGLLQAAFESAEAARFGCIQSHNLFQKSKRLHKVLEICSIESKLIKMASSTSRELGRVTPITEQRIERCKVVYRIANIDWVSTRKWKWTPRTNDWEEWPRSIIHFKMYWKPAKWKEFIKTALLRGAGEMRTISFPVRQTINNNNRKMTKRKRNTIWVTGFCIQNRNDVE